MILKKLVTPAIRDPLYTHIDSLPFEYREVVYAVLSEGKDRSLRENRLFFELTARNLLDDLERIKVADPGIDLDLSGVRDNWQFFSLKEAYEPLPKVEWLVDGLIGKPSLTIFFGPPKSLKTLLVQDMVMSVASGKRWLQPPQSEGKSTGLGIKTSPTIALWVDFENGARRMKERFSAFGRAYGLPGDAGIFCTSMPTPWLDASRPEQIGNLMLRISHYQAGLVVVDHLSQITGDIDENTSEMATIMGNLRGMVEASNLALILIHHQIKGASRFGISASDSLRGHGSILASCDLACLIERDAFNRDQILIKPAAVRGAGVDNISALFSYDHKNDDSRELQEARFWGVETESLDLQGEQAALEIVCDDPGINNTALRTALIDAIEGMKDYRARQVISRLERSGRIVVKSGDKKSKIYYLPEG